MHGLLAHLVFAGNLYAVLRTGCCGHAARMLQGSCSWHSNAIKKSQMQPQQHWLDSRLKQRQQQRQLQQHHQGHKLQGMLVMGLRPARQRSPAPRP